VLALVERGEVKDAIIPGPAQMHGPACCLTALHIITKIIV